MNKFKHCLYINFPFFTIDQCKKIEAMNRHVHYYIRHFRVLFQVNLMMQLKCHIVSGAFDVFVPQPLFHKLSSVVFVLIGFRLRAWKNYSMNLLEHQQSNMKRLFADDFGFSGGLKHR